MDGFGLGLFLFAAFLGGFASGVAGFAMGFVVAGIWLHVISPLQTTALIAGYGLWTQGYGVWKLRHSLSWRNVAPFIIGGTIGVPIGTMLLRYMNPAYLRGGVGLLLVVFGIYGLAQPRMKPLQAGIAADGGIGFLNGMLCGLTGFPGFIITVWCQLRGWPKDAQRAVFQPVMLAAIVVTAISLSVTGSVTTDTVRLYLLGLPVLLAGLWCGFKLYGKLDDAAFRKLILLLLLVSGSTLIVTQGWPILTQAVGAQMCKPALAIKDVKFSEIQQPMLKRRWTAVVSVDASRCAATAGTFEIGFLRLSELGPDEEFRQRFMWSSPTTDVEVDFSAYEAVANYWIDSVETCSCAK